MSSSIGFRLRTARGHLDGVIRMVDEDRYCIDVAATFGSAPQSRGADPHSPLVEAVAGVGV